MAKYSVPLKTADGEFINQIIFADNLQQARMKAKAIGEFGSTVGTPVPVGALGTPGVGQSPAKTGISNWSTSPAYGWGGNPTGSGVTTEDTGFMPGFGDWQEGGQGSWAARDPSVAAATAEELLPSLGMAIPEELPENFDFGAASAASMGTVPDKGEIANITGTIRPWSERVGEINVIRTDPEAGSREGGAGVGYSRVDIPSDMWRFDKKNPIGPDQIKQVMEHLAATEGRDSFNGAVNNFLRQAQAYFKANPPSEKEKGSGAIWHQVADGSYMTDERFRTDQKQILNDVIGAREKEIQKTQPKLETVQEKEVWDHLPDWWKTEKMYKKFQQLTPEEQEVAANHNLPSFFQQRPSEYLGLSPDMQREVQLNSSVIDITTLQKSPAFAAELRAAAAAGALDADDMLTDQSDLDLTAEDLDTFVGPESGWKPPSGPAGPAGPAVPVGPAGPTTTDEWGNIIPPVNGDTPPESFTEFTGPTGQPGGIVDDRGLFEISPTAGYRRAFGNVFGEGFGRRGPIGGYLERMQDPLTAAFQGGALRNLINPQPGLGLGAGDAEGMALPGQSFQSFLQQAQQAPGGLGSAWNQALQDVNTFRGMEQADVPVAAQQYFAPQSVQDVGQAARLMGAAQRGRYSPLVSGMFQPQSYEDLYGDYVLQEQDRAQLGQQAMPQNFYDFAASRFGL